MIQAILNAISMYWMIIAVIPKGVLNQLRKFFFIFLWRGKSESGIHWVAWNHIEKPKEVGDWGFNDLFKFGRAPAAKYVWTLIPNEGKWKSMMRSKYLDGGDIIEWIMDSDKSYKRGSMIWKAINLAFLVIEIYCVEIGQ